MPTEGKEGKPVGAAASGCCGCVAACFLLSLMLVLFSGMSSEPSPTVAGAPASQAPVVSGSEAVVVDGPGAFLCATEEASRELSRLKPGDSAGLSRLMSSGQVDLLPAGTRVKVTASHLATKDVTVLTGGAAGKSGSVPVEHLRAP